MKNTKWINYEKNAIHFILKYTIIISDEEYYVLFYRLFQNQ